MNKGKSNLTINNLFVFLFFPLKLLWRQFLKFKETELPVKETDKSRSKHIYQSFEAS